MAAQILASIEDINGFLPDMIEITDGADRQYQVDANRVVKAQLAGVYTPLILTGWDAPADTPELIRGIAARLVAAKYYAIQFSQEVTNIPAYSQNLYNEAISMLAGIKNGTLVVVDDTNTPIASGGTLDLEITDVTPATSSGDPVFTMAQEFA